MWTNLTGEESLEAEDVGWGLDGAENMGQEGERGEVGLGDIALMDRYTQNVQFIALAVVYRLKKGIIIRRDRWDIFITWLVCWHDSLGSAWKHKMEKKNQDEEWG